MALDRTQLQKLLCNNSLNKDRPSVQQKPKLVSQNHKALTY